MAENEKLVELMKAVKADLKANINEFVTELINPETRLIVPVSINPEPKDGVVAPGSVVSYITYHNEERDHNLILTFTDISEYRKYFPKGSTQILKHTYNELVSIVMNHNRFDGFIIDIVGENFAISRDTIKQIADSHIKMVAETEKINANDPDALLPAKDVKEEIISALIAHCKETEDINACWLMTSKRQNQAERTLVFVVDFDGDVQNTFAGIARAVGRQLETNQTIGMMSAKDKMAEKVIADLEPVYKK